MQHPDADIDFFSELTLFTGLEGAEVLRLIEMAELKEFPPGGTIVREGSRGDALYILYDGKLTVETASTESDSVRLATISDRGSFFGEVALVDPGPRSANVLAETSVSLLVLTTDALEGFYSEFPHAKVIILQNIARVLAKRLRSANAQFAKLTT